MEAVRSPVDTAAQSILILVGNTDRFFLFVFFEFLRQSDNTAV